MSMAGKYKLTPEQEIEIINIYQNQTISAKNIGKIYGVSERPILAILKRHNIHKKTTYEHMAKQFTPDEIKIIVKEYENGTSQEVLGNRFCVGRKSIRKLLKRNNIKIRNVQDNRKIKETDFQEIVRLYVQEYWSSEEIAIKYNVTHVSILNVLWEFSVNMRVFGEGSQLFTPKEEEEICQIYNGTNKTIAEISSIFNCTPGPIARILKKHKINIRKVTTATSWGISGYYKSHHFRSMNELSFIINYLERKNISFKSGETTEFGIKYYHSEMNKVRTYYPDFVTEKYMFENKPKYMWDFQENIEKFRAGQEYCKLHNLEYRIVDFPVIVEPILDKYSCGEIQFSTKGMEKFIRIYKGYLT